MVKFMQQLQPAMFNKLKAIAKERNVSIQELLRSIVIPEFVIAEKQKALNRQSQNNHVSDSTSRVDP